MTDALLRRRHDCPLCGAVCICDAFDPGFDDCEHDCGRDEEIERMLDEDEIS